MPPKKIVSSNHNHSSTKMPISKTSKTPQNINTTKPKEEPIAAAIEKPEPQVIKRVKMKQVVPKEMEKLENLKKWPIVLDEIGNLNKLRCLLIYKAFLQMYLSVLLITLALLKYQ